MLSQSVSTSELISFLEDIPELMQESPHHFRNSGQFPYWTSISLFNAPSYDAYPEHHADCVHTNLISIIVTRDPSGFLLIKAMLEKISNYLQWQIIVEEKDNEK